MISLLDHHHEVISGRGGWLRWWQIGVYSLMAPIFDLVRDIDTTKTNWAIKIRVIRVYEQMRYTNPKEVFSLDFVSHDKEIKKIDANATCSYIHETTIDCSAQSILAHESSFLVEE
ncbi:Uncharacterized protein Fot_51518 [Forsythia ovata]|uniref:Replication protein A 70 kDa DNA-binding subunit B/D first OB fold domain-containing protein n=1 Tax=Forsythia ovata TaxID=205694 RepID=A0ABD1PXA1_9LAMI